DTLDDMPALLAHAKSSQTVQDRKGSLVRNPVEGRFLLLGLGSDLRRSKMLLPFADLSRHLATGIVKVRQTFNWQSGAIGLKTVHDLKLIANVLGQKAPAVADHGGELVACWLVETHSERFLIRIMRLDLSSSRNCVRSDDSQPSRSPSVRITSGII